MKKRPLIIISLIALAIILVGAWGGLIGWGNLSGQPACAKLEESPCLARVNCEPIYMQSQSASGSIYFQKCASLTEAEVNDRQAEKQLCETTGGQWQRTKFGVYCDCTANANNLGYNQGQGCIEKF